MKVKSLIISLILIVCFAGIGIGLYCAWPAITGTITDSKYYTGEDLQEAYDKGLDDAFKNKDELTQQVDYYKELTDTYYISILDYQAQIKDYETLIENNQNTISSLEQNKEELQLQVDNLTTIKNNNETLISELESQITVLEDQVNDLEYSCEDKDNEISQLNSQISNLQDLVSQLQITNSMNIETIKSLNNQISNLNEQIVSLTNQIVSNDNSVNSLQLKIEELEKSILYYENYISSLESDTQIILTFEFAGSVYNIQVVDKNSIVSVTTPTSTDYVIFNYWTVNGEQIDLSTYHFTENTKIIADVTYKYQVKFMVDGVQYGETQIIEQNNCLTLPEAPVKDKYEFLGWSLNGEDILSNIDTIPVNEDLTYIAIFESSIYVTFMNGENIYEEIKVVDGQISDMPEAPTKDSYFFKGWSLNGVDIIDISTLEIEDSIYVYAVFTYNWDGTYTGRASTTNELTVNVENQEIVSISYRGTTYSVTKLESGSYRTTSGIRDVNGSYTYIHFTLSFGSAGSIRVSYKRNTSSNFNSSGASSSSSFTCSKES